MLEEIIPEGEQKGALFFPPLVPLDQAGPGEALIAAPGLTSRAELGRGVVEAIGFMVRGALETLNRRGFPVREMRLSGGQGKNARWNQLKADMSGVTLLVPEVRDAELEGDAILAAIALGEAADLDEAVRKMVHIKERYVPNPEAVPVYEEKFRAYEELRRKIRGLF
jgi:xylulokinase